MTTDATWGSVVGTTGRQQSPSPMISSSGWGQSNSNEPEQSANEPSGGGGWGRQDTDHGWGTGETSNTNSGWGGDGGGGAWGNSGGGSWGLPGNDSGSGGGGWGFTSKNDDTVNTTQSTAREGTTDINPQAPTSSDNAQSSPDITWGTSTNTWGSSDATWGSSTNTWGSSGNTWGSSTWGPSNNTWTSNETAQHQPVSNAGPDSGKEGENSVQGGGRSGWGDASNSETITGLPSSGGGWGNSTPAVPATVGVTQGSDFESYQLRSFFLLPLFPERCTHVKFFAVLRPLRFHPHHHPSRCCASDHGRRRWRIAFRGRGDLERARERCSQT